MACHKPSNLIQNHIRSINPKLVGTSAENIESYYSKLYSNPSYISLFTMPRFEERLRQLKLNKYQEERVREGLSEFSTLAQTAYERKFPEYYAKPEKPEKPEKPAPKQ